MIFRSVFQASVDLSEWSRLAAILTANGSGEKTSSCFLNLLMSSKCLIWRAIAIPAIHTSPRPAWQLLLQARATLRIDEQTHLNAIFSALTQSTKQQRLSFL